MRYLLLSEVHANAPACGCVATHYKHCGCRYEDLRQEALAHESFAVDS
ncbi:MAG: hypothetical protein JWM95_4395 [Gemmatimonadetes bacterium]|nr:hypothetical protein [Gemmatimonadota bacterium]